MHLAAHHEPSTLRPARATGTSRGAGGVLDPKDVELVLTRLGMAALRPRVPDPAVRGALDELGTLLEAVLAELRTLRRCQEETLELVRSAIARQPRARPQVASPFFGARAAGENEAERRPATVLLVDEDAAWRDAAATRLERKGLKVKAVSTGSDALAAIAVERPSLIVVELALQGELSGRELLDVIRATMEWVRIPVVIFTELPVKGTREARACLAADEYVAKSAGVDRLAERIERMLATPPGLSLAASR